MMLIVSVPFPGDYSWARIDAFLHGQEGLVGYILGQEYNLAK